MADAPQLFHRVATLCQGRCPACGQGALFDGLLALRDRCSHCGLDYDAYEAADGPAAFVILIVATIVIASAAVLEVNHHPPAWVHGLIWLPLIPVLSVAMMRPFKAMFFDHSYRHKAGHAVVAPDEDE